MRRAAAFLAASIRGLDVELNDFAVDGAVRDDQRLAADRTILDIGLLWNGKIERQVDALPTMRASGVLTLDEDHLRGHRVAPQLAKALCLLEIMIYFIVLKVA